MIGHTPYMFLSCSPQRFESFPYCRVYHSLASGARLALHT